MQNDRSGSISRVEPRRSRRRFWLALSGLSTIAAVALLSPYCVRFPFVRARIERALSSQIGANMRLGSILFGWSSGLTIRDIEIANPPFFPAEQPMLRLHELHADLQFLPLLSGRFDFATKLQGLQLSVIEQGGRFNLACLSPTANLSVPEALPGKSPGGVAQNAGQPPVDLKASRFAFTLTDANITIQRDGQLLESLTNLTCRASKEAGESLLQIDLDSQLAALPQRPAGTLHAACHGDPIARTGDLEFRAEGLDLARFRPLLEGALAEGALTSCSGRIDGSCSARIKAGTAAAITTSGALKIEQLQLAGGLLPGIQLQIGHLTLQPKIEFTTDAAKHSPRFSLAAGGGTQSLGLANGDLQGKLVGLRLTLDIGKPDSTRVSDPSAPAASRTTSATRAANESLAELPLRLDIEISDSEIQLLRLLEPVEIVRVNSAHIVKAFDATLVRIDLDGSLAALPGLPAAIFNGQCTVDTGANIADLQLTTTGLELARVRPFVDRAFKPGDRTELTGLVTGTCTVHLADLHAPVATVRGVFDVSRPHLAGALVRGMNVTAAHWHVEPNFTWHTSDAAALPVLASDFTLDLGCVQLHPLDATALTTELAGKAGIGFAVVADLDSLASFGGPIPSILSGTRGRVSGAVAIALNNGALPPVAELLNAFTADLRVESGPLSHSGFVLHELDMNVSLRNSTATVRTTRSTQLNHGPLVISAATTLSNPAAANLDITLAWQNGKVAGETAQLLRYLVPLLAGIDAKAANFAADMDLSVTLHGPLQKLAGENWLQYLNHWSGTGEFSLRDGKVVPAPALQGLMQPLGSLLGPKVSLGDNGTLALDVITSKFSLHQGALENKAMNWINKGRAIGLSGKVALDGTVELLLDLLPLLQAHKDGARIAQALANQNLAAGIGGTLDAPKLALPELGKTLRNALLDPNSALKQEAENLLQKGLQDLLHGRKK